MSSESHIAERAVVEAALERGFLTPAQLAEARRIEQDLVLRGTPSGLLAILANNFLGPAEVEQLRQVYSRSSGVFHLPLSSRPTLIQPPQGLASAPTLMEPLEDRTVAAPTLSSAPTIVTDAPTVSDGADDPTQIVDDDQTQVADAGATRAPPPTIIPFSARASGWRPGARVGDLVLQELLGQGGMGAVYLAQHPESGERFAVKCLSAESGSKQTARFRREAIAQTTVEHPNLVRVYSAGRAHDHMFIVMELATGGDLGMRLEADSFTLDESLELIESLAHGLAAVHAAGILHRDIKPGNVVFDDQGTPKLVDFGLARVIGEERLTATGTMLGTPGYMAPEQAEGAVHDFDARTDVYGLGSVLYHLLTGRPPFVSESTAVLLRKLLTLDPERPSLLVPGLPKEVDRVVLKAIAKSQEDRYATATEFAEDLARLRKGERVQARVVVSRRRRSRRRQIGIIAVAVACLVGAIVWAVNFRDPEHSGQEEVTPPVPPRLSLQARDTALIHSNVVVLRGETAGDAKQIEVRLGDQTLKALEVEEPGPFEVTVPLVRRDGERVVLPPLDPRPIELEVRVTGAGDPAVARVQLAVRGGLPPGVIHTGGHEYRAKDGSVLLYVPPGEFTRGTDQAEDGLAGPAHKVRLTRPFLAGKHEVTLKQYEAFLTARPEVPRPSWPGSLYASARSGQHAVSNVTWHEARAYGEWAGLRLLTETEWEYAARGADGRRYPWGDDPPTVAGKQANAAFGKGWKDGIRPVGSFPAGASPFGCLDMAGNVFEWVEDVKMRYLPHERGVDYPLEDPPVVSNRGPRGNRGGAYNRPVDKLTTTYRAGDMPNDRMNNTGFRVGASLILDP